MAAYIFVNNPPNMGIKEKGLSCRIQYTMKRFKSKIATTQNGEPGKYFHQQPIMHTAALKIISGI